MLPSKANKNEYSKRPSIMLGLFAFNPNYVNYVGDPVWRKKPPLQKLHLTLQQRCYITFLFTNITQSYYI